MAKVHLLYVLPDPANRLGRTHCGLEGWQEKHSPNEFSTALGNIFEARALRQGVTCKKCQVAFRSPVHHHTGRRV